MVLFISYFLKILEPQIFYRHKIVEIIIDLKVPCQEVFHCSLLGDKCVFYIRDSLFEIVCIFHIYEELSKLLIFKGLSCIINALWKMIGMNYFY